MDYSNINNLLGKLELDNQYKNQTKSNNVNELNHTKFNKKTKNDNQNINMSLTRNIQLMNDIGGNRVNLETINPQRNLVLNSKNSNTNCSKLEQERNQMYTHNNSNLHIIDYNLFSDNYKNRNRIEPDEINNKLGNRENTPNVAMSYSTTSSN
tara:strand:+ start:414 stop:872 length:459 start_codon:yes stop_codon:yes gene_type:complete